MGYAADFHPYGTSHWVVLALFVLVAAALVAAGRAYGERPWQRRGFALLILAVQVPLQVRVMLPERWSVDYSLPLQLCDLAWISAAIALWTRARWAVAVTYYWGVTLTAQAFVTPELTGPDFPSPEFLMFWAMHCFIVWAAVYLTWGLRLRPSWSGYRRTVAITAVWAAAMVAFNAATGSNYGFLNRKPPGASLLDLLGGWPWYLAVEVVAALAVWALITWPWVRAAERAPRPVPAAPTAGHRGAG